MTWEALIVVITMEDRRTLAIILFSALVFGPITKNLFHPFQPIDITAKKFFP